MGKTMSIVMKNKMNAAALAVCAALSVGYSAVASAADPVTFTTDITISSLFNCPVNTNAATTQWELTWTLADEDATSGTLAYDVAPPEPLTVVASLDAAASGTCDLSGLKVDADVTAAGVEQVSGQAGFYRQKTSNGYWRYAPVLSRVQLYTDAGTTAATGDVTVTDAAGGTHPQNTAALYTAHADLKALPGMEGNDALSLSNNYLAADALVPLSGGAMTTFAMTPPAVIKQATIGVSAIIAKNPEDDAGVTDVAAVNNTEVVRLPFTVNVAFR